MNWIPCTERLPAHGERVLVYNVWEEKVEIASLSFTQWDYGDAFAFGALDDVSHWMPAPEAPS